MALLANMMARNLASDDKVHFKDEIHMIPKWILTVPVTVRYLINLDAPVAKWKIYTTCCAPFLWSSVPPYTVIFIPMMYFRVETTDIYNQYDIYSRAFVYG